MNKLAESRIANRNLAPKIAFDKLPLPFREDVSPHFESTNNPTVGKRLNAFPSNSRNRRVCASDGEAKNLVEVETVKDGLGTAATEKPGDAEIKGKIVEFLWYLKKENYAESTIQRYVKEIKLLAKRGANLLDPESVKEVIARQKWVDNRRAQTYHVYNAFAKMLGKTWGMPRVRVQQKIGFCPTEKTVNQAIAGFGKKISIMVQLIKETGMRSGEADGLEWSQINFETSIITVIPEKGSNPTVKKVSRELLGRIQTLPRTSKKVFGEHHYNTMRTNLAQQRKRLAEKLGNPELLRLTFVSVRHFYGTKLYHRGKTLLEIQKIMGHKQFTSTLQYINYDKVIFGGEDGWICKIAESSEGRKKLIEAGFEFVEQTGNQSYYRKRKA